MKKLKLINADNTVLKQISVSDTITKKQISDKIKFLYPSNYSFITYKLIKI